MKIKLPRKLRSVFKRVAGKKPVYSTFSSAREYVNKEAAKKAFEEMRPLFLSVNNWTKFSGAGNASFHHYDEDGNPVNRQVKTGDLIKVVLPGPLPLYWVRIEQIRNEYRYISVKVRPYYDPVNKPLRKNITAHFFTRKTSSRFVLKRDHHLIIAEVRGKEEYINNQDPEAGGLGAVNTAVATGAWMGYQKKQWESYTSGLVNFLS